ncbi:VWA domain-containing protein [Mangrovimicrobium sediminis]|uniref:VWA domain-containing protein n=1 Tax=Mangrovimicrobium sediminis TaxID=2562682 RepID=A0A4Z0M5L7_9GAMM|nr:VWA domain-containing protein [Haliea sp. SAOS-164]TGD74784.1 VWA domain-containing protein [Haliea sp. SAOS-164]
MIEWLWPWMLLLAPLPWLWRRLAPPAGGEQPAIRAPFYSQWSQLAQEQRGTPTRGGLSLLALWAVWILLLLAAARPQWIGEVQEIPESGRDLMLAVDISGSMQVEDMKAGQRMVSRMLAVKQLGGQFIAERQGDRLGLILFGSRAYVQSPLSFDTATVKRFLDESQIGFAGQDTAIGDAIGLAVKRLKDRPADQRVLILLSDGRDTASSVQPLDAAQLAADLGIRIYTIGIGADRMVMPGVFGSAFGSRQVNPSADLDEDSLSRIATMTGGKYFRARNPQELAGIYQLLDELEPIELDSASYRPRRALGYLPLALALALSFALAAQRLWQRGALRAAWRQGAVE